MLIASSHRDLPSLCSHVLVMEAYGWVVVRVSRAEYALVSTLADTALDDIDGRVAEQDAALHRRLRTWLTENSDPWFAWQLHEQLNNATGILQFCVSRNHRTSTLWDLLDWLPTNAHGAYGLVYVRDDEDGPGVTHYGRGQVDHTNEFRVWRILNGVVDEVADPFLSPIVPMIEPNELA